MKTEATNFIVGRGLLWKKNSQRESEATLNARLFMSGSGLEWPARHCCSWLRPSVGWRCLGQRPTPKHPARRTRGATYRTQGSQRLMRNLVILLRQDEYTTRVNAWNWLQKLEGGGHRRKSQGRGGLDLKFNTYRGGITFSFLFANWKSGGRVIRVQIQILTLE